MPRWSRTHTARPRRSSANCGHATCASSISAPTSACAIPRCTPSGTASIPSPELIPDAVYGLPERYRTELADANLVANPGCFPTAALLALAPLAGAGLVDDVIIDAKTGVSGAGRAATERTHFVTVDENVSAYGVPRHRHTPEIEQELASLGAEIRVTFTPHLLPIDQGELVTCYVTTPTAAPPRSRRTAGAVRRGLRRRAVRRARRRAARRP